MVLCLQIVPTLSCFINTKFLQRTSNITWPLSLCQLPAITLKYPEPTFLIQTLIISSHSWVLYLLSQCYNFSVYCRAYTLRSPALLSFNSVDYNEGTNYNQIKCLYCSYYGVIYFQFSWLTERIKPPRTTVLRLSEPVSM